MSDSYIKLNKPRRNIIYTKLQLKSPKKIINNEFPTSLTTSLDSSRIESKFNINIFKLPKALNLYSIYNLSLSRNYSNSPNKKNQLKFITKLKDNSYSESVSVKNNTLNKTINIHNDCILKQIKEKNNTEVDDNKFDNSNNNKINSNLKRIKIPKLKKNESSKIQCLMREKFYCDVEKKMNNNFKKNNCSSDKKLLNKMIHLNQVVSFWKGVCDIVHPIITIEKYKESKNKFNKFIKNDSQIYSKHKPLPKIFTNSKLLEIKHNEKLKNKIKFIKILKENKKIISE